MALRRNGSLASHLGIVRKHRSWLLLAWLGCSPYEASRLGSANNDMGQDEPPASSIVSVSLKTAQKGKFIAAENGGGGTVSADRDRASSWETFQITKESPGPLQSGDMVRLKTLSSHYLQAENGGGARMHASSTQAGDWETFRLVKADGPGFLRSGDTVGLQTKVSGRWVSAENAGGSGLFAYGEQFGAWERFVLEQRPSSTSPTSPSVPETPTGSNPAPTANPGGPWPTHPGDHPFGTQVLLFHPAMDLRKVQQTLDDIASEMERSEFSGKRYAYLFLPGTYELDVKVGFYTEVRGLGLSPDDVRLRGAVRARADWSGAPAPLGFGQPHNATHNFWRGVENLSVVPRENLDGGRNRWHVSQATHLRRVHILGDLLLGGLEGQGYCSGGFLADSVIDKGVFPVQQQQWLTRNTTMGQWVWDAGRGNWNMVFVGTPGAPEDHWPAGASSGDNARPATVVSHTPRLREKPFLFVDASGKYRVMRPAMAKNTRGPSWVNGTLGTSLSIENEFHIAEPSTATSATLNQALRQGKHLLFTPGVYHLTSPLLVDRAGTMVLGIGMATLVADSGKEAVKLADVDGLTVSGLLLDAGPHQPSDQLLEVGPPSSGVAHDENPTALFDVHCRVGGALGHDAARADRCVTINSANVLVDHMWLWRPDHEASQNFHWAWEKYRAKNGIVVNGRDVTAYGLFTEHFQEYQALWNGEGGEVYFYQSELPYEATSQSLWMAPHGRNGFASYKVSDSVTRHRALGLGVYAIWQFPGVTLGSAVEFPENRPGVSLKRMVTAEFMDHDAARNTWANLDGGGAIEHIFNGQGAPAGWLGRVGSFSNE